MSNNTASAILIVAFFGFWVWVIAIFLVVFTLATHTDANNWIITLCAWGTSMIVGVPQRYILKALQA